MAEETWEFNFGQKREDAHTLPHEHHCKVTGGHDRKFTKGLHANMNAIIIAAVLFCSMTLAFIMHLNSDLQPDLNELIIALLCDLIRKRGDITVCDRVPEASQWPAPSSRIALMHALLYVSFTSSMFSALFAILCKRWLNDYIPAGVQEPAIEHDRNRQQESDWLVTWHFHRVVGLPLVLLQGGVLFFVCAFHQYLGEINITFAHVFFVVTMCFFIFSLSIQFAQGIGQPS